jgi:hypothetical protein
MGGSKRPETNSPANLVPVHGHGTAGCHGEIERRRDLAYDSGHLCHQFEDPQSRAIEHAVHGWVYLLIDGTVSHDPPAECGGAAWSA